MNDVSPDMPARETTQYGPSPEEGGSTMFCTACGTKNTPEANFCKQCGHKLEKTGPLTISEEDFAIPAGPDDRVEKLLVLAFQNYEAGDLEAAIKACSEALEIRPESTSAHSLMGTLYEKQGDREKAIAEYAKVLELNPGSIADREKLEQLRDPRTMVIPRKITSSRRIPGRAAFDSPVGAAIAAVATFLFVLLVGAWAVYARGARATTQAANIAPGTPLPVNSAPNRVAQYQNPTQTFSAPNYSNAYGANQQQAPVANAPRRARQESDESQPPARPLVPPARVSLASPNRSSQGAAGGNGTVYLPDGGPGPSEVGPPPGSNTAVTNNPNNMGIGSSNVATAPQQNKTGKIEIVVSQEPQRASGSSARGGSGEGNTASMDSRSALASARQLQMSGNYSRAITQYTKALDGAGDDAAPIHQQIGLCYQRLDQKDSAITHYNDAIAAYRSQIGAGHNVEAANRGIKACEAGIRACQ